MVEGCATKVQVKEIGENVKQYTVTIPRALAEAMGWGKGDIVYWKTAGKDTLILKWGARVEVLNDPA